MKIQKKEYRFDLNDQVTKHIIEKAKALAKEKVKFKKANEEYENKLVDIGGR